jgi:hypothetical protein
MQICLDTINNNINAKFVPRRSLQPQRYGYVQPIQEDYEQYNSRQPKPREINADGSEGTELWGLNP